MKFFNGFKAVLMASFVMPMALMSTFDEDKKRAAGWSALSVGSFAIKKICQKKQLLQAAYTFDHISRAAALNVLVIAYFEFLELRWDGLVSSRKASYEVQNDFVND